MSLSGGSGKSNQTTTQRVELPPWLDAKWQDAATQAEQYAATPFTPYTGQMAAGLSGNQQQAYDTAAGTQGQYRGVIDSAINQTQAALNAVPQGYTAAMGSATGYDPATTQAAQIGPLSQIGNVGSVSAGTGAGYMDAYSNPYEDAVVARAMQDIGRQADIAGNSARSRAAAAGSFGGSRSSVLEGETARGYADAAAQTAANIRAQGFNTALQAGQTDANRALQAGTTNLGAGLTVAQANQNALNTGALAGAGYQQQANLANQQALNAAGQFGAAAGNAQAMANQQALNSAGQFNSNLGLAGRGQTLGGAAQLGSLGQAGQAYNQADINNLLNTGGISQAATQAGLDAAYQEFLRQQGDTPDKLNTLIGALSANPYNRQGSTSTRGGSSSKGASGTLFG